MSLDQPTFPTGQLPAHQAWWIRPDLFWVMCCVPLAVVAAVTVILLSGGPAVALYVVAALGVISVVALAVPWAMIARRGEAPRSQWTLGVVIVVVTIVVCALVAYSIYEIIRTAR
jgi:hypothetical protein